ncbi:MAG: glycosyltransferase [Nitrospirota bacterium]|nr:glycosyltransferase [Nitrospirota bacterium]
MIERIPTLILYAKSVPHWRRVVADTLVGGLRLTPDMVPAPLRRSRRVRFLFAEEYRTLSYLLDWQEAFCEASSLDERLCNINNLFEYQAALRTLQRYPLIVILHSAAGDNMALLRRAASRLKDRRGKLVLFLGNEYNGMPDKIGFARDVAADYIASQLPREAAAWLYAECGPAKIVEAPPALNPKLYQPQTGPRPVDLGFRGDRYEDRLLGDRDRARMLHAVAERADRWGLVKDMACIRYPRDEWSRFLGTCKGIVGAESGTAYLERDDRTQEAVKQYLARRPEAPFEEVFDRFFKPYPHPVSGKAVSSRHFEPIGTKTCQILLEGRYNGILQAEEHYISVKPDLSNLDEAIRRFKDDAYRQAMVERAYEYVLAGHTYRHRVDRLLRTVVADGLPSW